MAKEIEAKMKVDDFHVVHEKLRNGGLRHGSELETNIFFDTPKGSLRRGDRGMRIRVAFNERGKKKCTVTFKGPLEKGRFKTRKEIEFVVNDPGAAKEFFAELGFHETMSFEKRRESWTFRNCKIALDELPFLGKYVEVEGDSDQSINRARTGLGLGKTPLITWGYITLLTEYVRKHRIADHHLGL